MRWRLRIGLLSDTHGFLGDAVFWSFAECDEIWHARDFRTVKVLDRLTTFRSIRGVYGNIDGAELRAEVSSGSRCQAPAGMDPHVEVCITVKTKADGDLSLDNSILDKIDRLQTSDPERAHIVEDAPGCAENLQIARTASRLEAVCPFVSDSLENLSKGYGGLIRIGLVRPDLLDRTCGGWTIEAFVGAA